MDACVAEVAQNADYADATSVRHDVVTWERDHGTPARVRQVAHTYAVYNLMNEHQVTIGEETFPLEEPFLVMATQNPIEQEGTYPLPEAQLDRFLVQIDVPYPTRDAERDILIATTGTEEAESHQVFSAAELIAAQALVRRMPVGEGVVELILDLVRACRPEDETAPEVVRANVGWGPGPRAAQALMLTVRAAALLDGRLVPSAEDVADMAAPVLTHRMALTFAARARGVALADVIGEVVSVTKIDYDGNPQVHDGFGRPISPQDVLRLTHHREPGAPGIGFRSFLSRWFQERDRRWP